jgi:beta-galactosidase
MRINGIRSNNNPPAPKLLEICDGEGVLILDEAFDIWRRQQAEYDYHVFFNEWHERNLTDFVKRDRNHACIFMWGIANELPEQDNHGVENTEIERLTRTQADLVKSLDKTRPVTVANIIPYKTNPS